jgi:nickel-dependent lactate racemase
MKKVNLYHGKRTVTLEVPQGTTILEPAGAPTIIDPQQAVRAALANPIDSPPLIELLRRRNPGSVAITISDITRAVPNRVFLPFILQTIAEAGIASDRVTIIIGTGMHRPSTAQEHQHLLGEQILSEYRVVDHRSDRPETLVQVSDNPYVGVCALFADADFRIVTGFVEPHFMAGYSGGRKGVCPAMVDLKTIQRFHGYETLSDTRAREGVLEGNPCHEISLSVARKVGVDFLFNVAIDREKRLAGVYCGDLEAAHQAGCEDVARWTAVQLEGSYDLVVTSGGGYPLDQTYYQTVKGMVMALPAMHEESKLLLVSSCAEQLGSPEYTELMTKWGRRWPEFMDEIARNKDRTLKDQWELQIQTRVLQRVASDAVFLASEDLAPDLQAVTGITPLDGSGDVTARAQHWLDEQLQRDRDASVAVIPDGPYTMLWDPKGQANAQHNQNKEQER